MSARTVPSGLRRPLRIIHVVWTLDPASGGPPHVAIRLAAAQAALGHEVVLVSNVQRAQQSRVRQQIERVPHHERVALHSLLDPSPLERVLALRARRLLRDLSGTADFLHIHGVWHGILKAAADVAAGADLPYCFRPAGMLHPAVLAQKAWKKKPAMALGFRRALKRASFIHALNEDEKRLIEPLRLGVPSVVLPNGVFLEEIQPLPTQGTFRTAHPELGSRPFVLFLSRLHFNKGLDVLADGFVLLARQREDVRLVVAGPDGGARADFIQRISEAGLADRVHLVGPLYARDKLAAMVDASCFCLPSRHEGFSVAITEAMACGVPVVVAEGCHFPEVAEAGAGKVVPLTAGALSAALHEVLADPARAARMGAAGAELVRSRYTWQTIAERTIGVYQTALRSDA